jgi:hypothetical protein
MAGFPVDNNNTWINDGLWKTASATETVIKSEGLLNLSLTSIFAVDIKAGNIANTLGFTQNQTQTISLLAYEAVLPGASYELGSVFGDRQGVTEQYPTKRIYPPVDVSFYIKYDYDVLRFFNGWMDLISPLNEGGGVAQNAYFKFNYPNKYECNINIVKFEREFRPSNQRLSKRGTEGGINDPKTYTYSLINAYPSNLISVPVSYEQSNILRTTITFNYDRYYIQENVGKLYQDPNQPNQPNQTNATGGTLGELNRQVDLINRFIPSTGLNPIPRGVG